MIKMRLHVNPTPKMLIILCPNHFPFQDLSDVVKSREKIIIGAKNPFSLQVYHDLENAFPKLRAFVEARVIPASEIIAGYGMTYHLYLAGDFRPAEPDRVFYALTEKWPSHLVPFYPVNSGDYFIKSDEKRFYTNTRGKYKKMLLENNVIQRIYPYLTVDTKLLYLPTIGME